MIHQRFRQIHFMLNKWYDKKNFIIYPSVSASFVCTSNCIKSKLAFLKYKIKRFYHYI